MPATQAEKGISLHEGPRRFSTIGSTVVTAEGDGVLWVSTIRHYESGRDHLGLPKWKPQRSYETIIFAIPSDSTFTRDPNGHIDYSLRKPYRDWPLKTFDERRNDVARQKGESFIDAAKRSHQAAIERAVATLAQHTSS